MPTFKAFRCFLPCRLCRGTKCPPRKTTLPLEKLLSFACRVRAAQAHLPPGQGLAKRVARRASFLIKTWNASGLRTSAATVLLPLSVGALSLLLTAACPSIAMELVWVPLSKLACCPDMAFVPVCRGAGTERSDLGTCCRHSCTRSGGKVTLQLCCASTQRTSGRGKNWASPAPPAATICC